MIADIFGTLTQSGSAFLTFLTGLLNSVISIFYTAAEGSTPGSLTDIGILTLVGVATSFVFFGLRWITKLIKLRG